jgi:23S rRNA (cytidine1920-2'-O)/16S rRNA (cytidine1409-2'-O)-methyltransferase
MGFQMRGLDFSPIRGPEGNIEFLLWMKIGDSQQADNLEWFPRIRELVLQAQLGTE